MRTTNMMNFIIREWEDDDIVLFQILYADFSQRGGWIQLFFAIGNVMIITEIKKIIKKVL